MRAIGLFLAAVPFGFGLTRAVSTGTDFRYVWLALAAAVAAGATLRHDRREARPAAAQFVGALIASTVAAIVTGVALGARSVPAVLIVALGFAVCEAGGLTLWRRIEDA